MSQDLTLSPPPTPPRPIPTPHWTCPLIQSLSYTEWYRVPPHLQTTFQDRDIEEGVEMIRLYVQLGQKQPLQKVR